MSISTITIKSKIAKLSNYSSYDHSNLNQIFILLDSEFLFIHFFLQWESNSSKINHLVLMYSFGIKFALPWFESQV